MALVLKPKLPKLDLPKINIIKIRIQKNKSNKLSRAEKFKLLCPLWYEVLTTKIHFQRLVIKTENQLSYHSPLRCVMGEAYGFQTSRAGNHWWNNCNTCSDIGDDFIDLTHKICMSNGALNRNNQVKKFITHMERCHPDIIGDKWKF